MKARAKKVLKKLKRAKGFKKGCFEESAERLNNPGRGFYHIYTLNASPPKVNISLSEEIWFYDNAESERLALALIDLSAFRASDISEEALLRIDNILNYFKQNNKQIILRFVYDTQGNCIINEPLSLSQIKRHIKQISASVKKYSDDILVMQGLLLGNWGEMHGSKFSDEKSIRELALALYGCTEGACYIALRTPSQIRAVLGDKNAPEELKKRIALFNDAMFASPTDLGTYGVADGMKTKDAVKRMRTPELEWINENLYYAPNGGEAVSDKNPISFSAAASEMRLTHTAYLNSAYNKIQLDYWKNERVKDGVYKGISGYDYIERHLGFRFYVRDAYVKKGKELFIEIENVGFADLTKEAECVLTLEEENGAAEELLLNTDPRNWHSLKRTVIPTGVLLKKPQNVNVTVYLSLRLKYGKEPVIFANKGAGERLKIGELTY